MKTTVRLFALLLALLMLGTMFAACKNEPDEEGGEKNTGELITDGSGIGENPYAGVNFEGRLFQIHVNKNEAGFSSSSAYIASVDELTSENNSCEQAVFNRDAWMRESLNMEIEYTLYDAPYGSVAESLRMQMQSDAQYDLYIDKLFPMANLSLEGWFTNVANRLELQYFEEYWYNDYMTSLSLDEGNSMYLLAGDYFMDVLRSSNVMFVNLEMLDDRFAAEGGSAAFLEKVIAGNWTYDDLISCSKEAYIPGQGVSDRTFGLLLHTVWEPMIPMLASTATFAENDADGRLVPTVNSDRNAEFFDKLVELFDMMEDTDIFERNMSNDLGLSSEFGVSATLDEIQNLFIKDRGLFTNGRFASMEKLGQSDLKYSVIPYPKFDAKEEYVTPSHDTTEIGAIPRSVEDDGTVLQMLDIISALTNEELMEIYYEETLKLRYSTDETVASIVDIIHEHMGSAFVLAYNDACSGSLLWSPFYEPLRDGRNFLANYPSVRNALESGLKSIMNKWNEIS